jgi:hypothetical protein
VETFDGKSIYFTSADVLAEVWVIFVNGGEETAVLRKVLGHASRLGPRRSVLLIEHRFEPRQTRDLMLVDPYR